MLKTTSMTVVGRRATVATGVPRQVYAWKSEQKRGYCMYFEVVGIPTKG